MKTIDIHMHQRIRVSVEQGEFGLWYVTSSDMRGFLVAAHTEAEAWANVPRALSELLSVRNDIVSFRIDES